LILKIWLTSITNYWAQAGFGIADLWRIEIIGESISKRIKTYKRHSNIDKQLSWMKPAI